MAIRRTQSAQRRAKQSRKGRGIRRFHHKRRTKAGGGGSRKRVSPQRLSSKTRKVFLEEKTRWERVTKKERGVDQTKKETESWWANNQGNRMSKQDVQKEVMEEEPLLVGERASPKPDHCHQQRPDVRFGFD